MNEIETLRNKEYIVGICSILRNKYEQKAQRSIVHTNFCVYRIYMKYIQKFFVDR